MLNKDFRVEYKDNVQPGTATVKLSGMGNYTGQRETTFRILNIASGTDTTGGSGGSGGSGFSGGGSSSYSYGGFGSGEFESTGDFGDEEEEDDDFGRLVLTDPATGNEVDYGTVLFDAEGIGYPFVQFTEEVRPGEWELMIIPDPMEDEETAETLYLDDAGERERYEELHLRLPMSLVDELTKQGYTSITYEFDKADLVIPLVSLVREIRPEGDDTYEAVDDDEVVELGGPEQETEVMHVALYDICVEQVENLTLTDRETNLLGNYSPLTGTYRLRVGVVTEESGAARETGNESLSIDEGTTMVPSQVEALPENHYPADMQLLLLPLDEDETAGAEDDEALLAGMPSNATTLYMSYQAPLTPAEVQAGIQPVEIQDVVDMTPTAFNVEDGMLYAEILPQADGIYAVGTPGGV